MPFPFRSTRHVSRRGFVAGAILGVALARASWRIDEDPLDPIRQRASALRLSLVERKGDHYVAIGDAPAGFTTTALELCEGLARDYLDHFKLRKFDVDLPERSMVLVVLSSPAGLNRFLDLPADSEVRGVYDLDANHLVVCDNRGDSNPAAERANTITLFHEGTHQLTFNTGLLDRFGDVPKVISEGLGTYGEVRRPRGQVKLGARNPERLQVLAALRTQGGQLLPVERLLVEDDLFDDPESFQLAYSQSWLLVHRLMQPDRADRFRNYLDALRIRKDSAARRDDAREHLGEFDRLDRDLASHANRLLR